MPAHHGLSLLSVDNVLLKALLPGPFPGECGTQPLEFIYLPILLCRWSVCSDVSKVSRKFSRDSCLFWMYRRPSAVPDFNQVWAPYLAELAFRRGERLLYLLAMKQDEGGGRAVTSSARVQCLDRLCVSVPFDDAAEGRMSYLALRMCRRYRGLKDAFPGQLLSQAAFQAVRIIEKEAADESNSMVR